MSGLVRVSVEDASSVRPARAAAVEAAVGAGFAQSDVDRVALVATELAENLHRHAVGGELVVVTGAPSPTRDVVLVALDRGPGVASIARCFADGYSTAGTLGTGLGAVARLSASVDAVSEPGRGTVVAATSSSARSGSAAGPAPGGPHPDLDVAAFGFPIGGEDVSGDGWALARDGARVVVLVADGLGHGEGAAVASTAAASVLLDRPPGVLVDSPAAVLARAHTAMTGTRGAAVSVVSLDAGVLARGGELTVAGVGNVAVLVADPDGGTERAATAYGTAGVRMPRTLTDQVRPVAPGSVVVLHSDGLTTRWNLTGRSPLLGHSALVIAAALWRDHSRGSDDSLVVVLAPGRGPAAGSPAGTASGMA